MTFCRAAVLAALLAVTLHSAQAARLIVFGDGLADDGNGARLYAENATNTPNLVSPVMTARSLAQAQAQLLGCSSTLCSAGVQAQLWQSGRKVAVPMCGCVCVRLWTGLCMWFVRL